MSSTFLGTNPSPEVFRKWCKSREIFLHPDMGFLVPTKTMGMGVFAKRALPVGTVVVSCPAAASISPYSEPTPDSPCISSLTSSPAARQDPVLHVVMRVLAELCRPTTPWRPWLESCPTMSDHLFALSGAQAEAFGLPIDARGDASAHTVTPYASPPQWTCIAQQLQEMRVKERWACAQELIQAHPEFWPPAKATFELFCECMAQVSSRNFHREEIVGREGPYLLPGLDVINHSFLENATFEIRGGGRKHAAAFTVVTTRPLQRGEQVYSSYGSIGTARFAVEFQFTTDAVQHEDIVRFSARTLASLAAYCQASLVEGERATPTIAAVQDLEDRVDRLQRLGILYDEGLYLLQPAAEVGGDGVAACTQDRDTAAKERAKAVESNIRVLTVTVDMLFADRATFDDKYVKLSRDSEPTMDATLRGHVVTVLEAKRHAAERQNEAVDELFLTEGDAGRRRLLHAALNSEIKILELYQELIRATPGLGQSHKPN